MLSKSKINCDVFDCEKRLNLCEKKRVTSKIRRNTWDPQIEFVQCTFDTLIINIVDIKTVSILNCTIKNIKCGRNVNVTAKYCRIGNIDDCDLCAHGCEIEIFYHYPKALCEFSAINKLIIRNVFLLGRYFYIGCDTQIKKIISSKGTYIGNNSYVSKYSAYLAPSGYKRIYAEDIIIRAYRKYKMRRKIQILHELKKYLIRDLAAIVLQYCYV